MLLPIIGPLLGHAVAWLHAFVGGVINQLAGLF